MPGTSANNHPRAKWRDFGWSLIGIAALSTLALGLAGFAGYFAARGESRSLLDLLYLTLQLFALQSGSVPGPVPWALDLARFLAPLIAASAAVKGFALIFREQFQKFRVKFLADHLVVCGLGEKGWRLVRHFSQRQARVIAIEKDAHNDLIGRARDLGAVVLIGDASEREVLREARCHRAARLFAVCGSDGTNAEAAVQASRLASVRRKKALACSAHIIDPGLCNLLKGKDMEGVRPAGSRLEFFNIYDQGARLWLKEHPPFGRDGRAVLERPHILLVGIGALGQSLLVQAGRQWDAFPHGPGIRLGWTIVASDAERRVENLFSRYPSLEGCCDLTILSIDTASPSFVRADFLFGQPGKGDITAVFICLDDDSLGLSAALSLRRRLRGSPVSLVVGTSREEGLPSLLRESRERDEDDAPLFIFGLLDRVDLADLALGGTNEVLARAIHDDYVRERLLAGETSESNAALVPWTGLPDTLRESNRSQADHIGAKLRAVGCGIEVATDWRKPPLGFTEREVEVMARMEHDRWWQERRRNGWKPGPKDVGKRRSPYLVPWEDLTEEIKERDRVFVRALPSFLAAAGFEVRRMRAGLPA